MKTIEGWFSWEYGESHIFDDDEWFGKGNPYRAEELASFTEEFNNQKVRITIERIES